MLVGVWEALDAAIPRLEAHEHLALYTVTVLASPYIEEESRNSILGGWRKLLSDGREMLSRITGSSTTKSRVMPDPLDPGATVERLDDGSILKRGPRDLPFEEVVRRVRRAFGPAIRD